MSREDVLNQILFRLVRIESLLQSSSPKKVADATKVPEGFLSYKELSKNILFITKGFIYRLVFDNKDFFNGFTCKAGPLTYVMSVDL